MSNLLERASILLTPTAVSDDTLHSVKPVRTFSNELITNGGFDADTNWTKFSNATISGGTVNLPNASAAVRQDGVGLETDKNYKITYDVISSSGDNVLFTTRGGTCLRVSLPSSVGTHTVFARTDSTGGDEFFISVKAFSASAVVDNVSVKKVTQGDFSFSRLSTATRVNSSGLIESVVADFPRIDFTSGTGLILLEPNSTNRLTYSEDFTQSIWTNTRSSGATNQTTAPDGTTTGYKLIDSTDNNTHLLFSSQTVTTSDVFAFSIFLKKGSLDNGFIAFDSGINQSVVFNLQNGTIVSTGSGITSSKIENFGNGWFKCSFTHTPTSTTRLYRVGTYNGSISYAGTGNDFIYCWGAQLEQKSFATSYIPTSGSTVTRAVDKSINSGDSSLINHVEGVIYFNARFLHRTSSGFKKPISISDGTGVNSNVVYLMRINNNEDSFTMTLKNSSGVGGGASFTIPNCDEFFKLALRYKSGESKVFLNGVQQGTTKGFTFSLNPFTKFNLSNAVSSEQFEGELIAAAVFKEALDNDELECLTGSGFDSFTALAEAGSYTII